MKRSLLITIICLFSGFISIAQDHLAIQKEAEQLYDQQKFSEALSVCQRALSQAEINVGKEHLDYINILHDLGNYKLITGDYLGAFTDLLAAKNLIEKIGAEKTIDNVKLLSSLGTAFAMAGEGEDARGYFQKALDIKKELKGEGDLEYGILLGSLAQVQSSMANYKDAELNLLRSKKIFENNKATDSLDYGSLLNNMASLYQDLANYPIAEKYYKMAAKVYLKTVGANSENYATLMQNLGNLYSTMGDYDEAEKCFNKAREVKEKIYGTESFMYSTILNDLAYLYNHTGEYAKSEGLYLQTLQLKKKVIGEEHESYLRTKQNLAMLYSYLGRDKNAEKMLEEVVAKVAPKKKEDPLIYTDYIENLGCLYTKSKKYGQAGKLLKEALASYRAIFGENHPEYIRALNNLAYLHNEEGSIEDAKKYYELAIKTCEKENSGKLDMVTALNNLSGIYAKEKAFPKALENINKAIAISDKIVHKKNPGRGVLLQQQAICLTGLGRFKEADGLYTDILDNYLKRLDKDFAFMTEAERADFVKDINTKVESYFSFISLANTLDTAILKDGLFADKMMDYRLATKAILLNSSDNIKKVIAKTTDSVLIKNYYELKKTTNHLSKVYAFSVDDIAASGINLDSLENARALLEKKLSSVLALNKNERVTWKDVQKRLIGAEAAIEIIRTENAFTDGGIGYSAIIITKKNPHPLLYSITGGEEFETTWLNEYRKNIRSRKLDTISFARYFKKLYELTAENAYDKIYFSGDGVYNQININTLANPKDTSYMLQEYNICYVTNLKDVPEPNRKKATVSPQSYAALFGFPDYGMALLPTPVPDNGGELVAMRAGARGKWTLAPLPGTKTEVEEINKVLQVNKMQTKLFLADRSDEATVKKMKNPYVLHIATHGFFESNIPKTPDTREVPEALKRAAENPLLRSGVMMAGASNSYSTSFSEIPSWESYEDGILTAYEVMNLDLDSTELVVLSACQTGLGEVKNGEGVYGLQRAFLVAGAKSVIMSLWSVSDDATRDLMILFYDRWLKIGDKRIAFNEAQIELKKKYPQPYYWGAFVLIER